MLQKNTEKLFVRENDSMEYLDRYPLIRSVLTKVVINSTIKLYNTIEQSDFLYLLLPVNIFCNIYLIPQITYEIVDFIDCT